MIIFLSRLIFVKRDKTFKIIYFSSNLYLTSSLNYFKNYKIYIKYIFMRIIDIVKIINNYLIISKIAE